MQEFKRKTNKQKKEELDALTRQLHDGINDYIGSERYTALLDSISRFHNYSISNSIIIGLQKPEASQVASFTTWKSMNRSIKKGEKGIQIFCPVKFKHPKEIPKTDDRGNPMLDADGKQIVDRKMVEEITFKIGYVFDVSQTQQISGKKEFVLSPVNDLVEEVKDYDSLRQAIEVSSPVPIEVKKFRSSAKGFYSDDQKKIVVQDGMSESQTIKTMIHEMAHAYLHGHKDTIEEGEISYYVAECMEFPTLSLAEYHDNLTFEEAVSIYWDIPEERLNAGKGIGFVLHDDSDYSGFRYPLVQNDQVQIDQINLVKHYRESFAVQKAIMNSREYFDDGSVSLRSTRELQAESVAYVVCQHYGIDTSDYSFGYVATWSEHPDQIMENLEPIKTCSSKIIDGIDNSMKEVYREQMDIHSEKEMADALDRFMEEVDRYDYNDQELYPGYNLDQVLYDVRHGKTQEMESYLHDLSQEHEDPSVRMKSKQLEKCLRTFRKSQLPEMDIEKISIKRGIKR